MSMESAQRTYDNQAPDYNELPDELVEEYMETEEFSDWIMEEAGNGDWVEWTEQNYDAIVERATEYWNDLYEAAADVHAEQKMERMRGND